MRRNQNFVQIQASQSNLSKKLVPRKEVSLSAFAFLFSEIVQQLVKADGAVGSGEADLEKELHDLGVPLGQRVLELTVFRERSLNMTGNIC